MAKRKKTVLVFDGDETLWLCNYLYDRAYLLLFLYLNEIFGSESVYLHGIYFKFFEIEKQKADVFGVTQERVTSSMIELYRAVCFHVRQYQGKNFYDEQHKKRIREIARIPFDYQKMPWIDGAESVLQTLQDKSHTLCLLSSYDVEVWPDKKRVLNINRFFNDEHIKTTQVLKTREDFIQVSGWTPKTDSQCNWWVIGNGKSDITPALGISKNWKGLHIRRGSTSPYFEDMGGELLPPPMGNPRVKNLTRIEEVLRYI